MQGRPVLSPFLAFYRSEPFFNKKEKNGGRQERKWKYPLEPCRAGGRRSDGKSLSELAASLRFAGGKKLVAERDGNGINLHGC